MVISGDVDVVTDGRISYRVHNGHPMMRSVTGTGCQMSVLIGAYAAANPEKSLLAALAGDCVADCRPDLITKEIFNMKKNQTLKLTLAAVLCAVAVVGSMLSFPVFGSKCAKYIPNHLFQ